MLNFLVKIIIIEYLIFIRIYYDMIYSKKRRTFMSKNLQEQMEKFYKQYKIVEEYITEKEDKKNKLL